MPAKKFGDASLECKDDSLSRYSAWLHYLSAFGFHLASSFYGDDSFEDKAIENLETAVQKGKNSWFSGVRIVVNELRRSPSDETLISAIGGQTSGERLIRCWQEFIESNKSKKRTPHKTWEMLCQTLLEGTHNAMCDSLQSVLELMGFEVRNYRDQKGRPDMLAFSIFGSKFVLVVEVKTKEQGDELGRDEVDQVTGHKAGYQRQYPDHRIFPLVFTNKEKQSSTALEKAKHNARILLAPVFVSFLKKYFQLIDMAPKATDPSTRLGLLDKIPSLDSLIPAFDPSEKPIVEHQELTSIIQL